MGTVLRNHRVTLGLFYYPVEEIGKDGHMRVLENGKMVAADFMKS